MGISVLEKLGQAAGVAGEVVGAVEQKKRQAMLDAIAQLKAERESRSASILDALRGAQTTKALQPPTPKALDFIFDQANNAYAKTPEGLKKLASDQATGDFRVPTATPTAPIAPQPPATDDVVGPTGATGGAPPTEQPPEGTGKFGTREPKDHVSAIAVQSPGKPPEIITYNTETGRQVGTLGNKPATTGATGGTAQNMQARLLGAVSEGRLADERMSAFEAAHMKNGKLDVSTAEDIGAALNTGLSGAHTPVSIILGRGAGGLMNAAGKGDVVQYQRDARLIARAEQLMSARGGSEAMAADNAFLAQGAANAPEATVRAAAKSRKALFGELGAVIQTLSPDQIERLNTGLASLEQSDPSFASKSPLEQTLDAIDASGLANDIRNAVRGRPAPSRAPSNDPEFDALMAKYKKP